MTEGALAELLSSDDAETEPLDSDAVTTCRARDPSPQLPPKLRWRKRAP